MSRRHSAEKREVIPDAKYHDVVLAKFMNSIMYDGKKSAAEAIVYGAFDLIEQKAKAEPLPLFKQALELRIGRLHKRSHFFYDVCCSNAWTS